MTFLGVWVRCEDPEGLSSSPHSHSGAPQRLIDPVEGFFREPRVDKPIDPHSRFITKRPSRTRDPDWEHRIVAPFFWLSLIIHGWICMSALANSGVIHGPPGEQNSSEFLLPDVLDWNGACDLFWEPELQIWTIRTVLTFSECPFIYLRTCSSAPWPGPPWRPRASNSCHYLIWN